MAEKYIKIPITRFEPNRRLVLDIFVYLPRNARYVRLRQSGQFFEPQILENYRTKGHAELLVGSDGLTETDPEKIILHDFTAPLMGSAAEFSGEDNTKAFEDGAILAKKSKEAAPEQDNVLKFAKKESKDTSDPAPNKPAENNEAPDSNSSPENVIDLSSARKNSVATTEPPDADTSKKPPATILDLTAASEQLPEIKEEPKESKEKKSVELEAERKKDHSFTESEEPTTSAKSTEDNILAADKGESPDILEQPTLGKKKKASLEPSTEEKEEAEKRKEAKKRFFDERLKNIRERQNQEAAQRKKKDAAVAARKKREEEIKKVQAAAAAVLDERRFSADSEATDSTRVSGGGETEESQRIRGGSKSDNTQTTVRGKATQNEEEELRFGADAKQKQHRSILASTEKLDETMEKLKETYLQKHKEGTLDNFELSRLDPELEQEVERAIISNELGKKLVVLGMQLESVRERERESNTLSHEEIAENNEFRTKILGKVDQIEVNLVKNKKGETIDEELRSELNIDFLKEEIIETVRQGNDPLEKVFTLGKQMDEIKIGLAKTEHLIESKEVTKVIAAAAPGKPNKLEEILYSGSTAGPESDPEATFRNILSTDDPLRKDYYQRLAEDEEMRVSSEAVAQHFKNSHIHEISNYTTQLAIAQGFHEPGFLRELVMAALISLSEKRAQISQADLPRFTKELLNKAETYESLDTTYVDALQIIALVKEVISTEGFAAGAARIDQKILEPALQNALGKEEVFSLTFLERTKQFVERGIKLHDSGLSFQLSREAILDLRKMCS